MVTNLKFNNRYGYFDTIFIYAANTFLSSIVLYCTVWDTANRIPDSNMRIQISHRLIFLTNHSFLTFCNCQSVPHYSTYVLTTIHDDNELPMVAQADKIVH